MESKGNNRATVYFRPLNMVDVTQTALYELSSLILIKLSLDIVCLFLYHRHTMELQKSHLLSHVAENHRTPVRINIHNLMSPTHAPSLGPALPGLALLRNPTYIPDSHRSSPGSLGFQGVEPSDRHACFPWGSLCTIKTRRQASPYCEWGLCTLMWS